jgi:uncharacterized protein (TIGR02118 family)
MYQLIALFRQPADPAAFEKIYWETHVPLARKIPGLVHFGVSKFQPGKDGPAKYYQLAALSFSDKEAFKAAMKSPENAEAGANLSTFARDLVEFYTAETMS